MLERHLLEFEFGGRHRRVAQQIVPQHRVRMKRRPVVAIQVRQVDDPLERAQLVDDLVDLFLPVERLAAVLVTVDVEHHFRRELRETIQHAARAEVGSATRPDRPDAGGRQHGDNGLRDVGHVGNHTVTGLHIELAELRGENAYLGAELFPGHGGERRALIEIHQRSGVGALISQGLLRIIQARAGKPFRARHVPVGEHAGVRGRGLHVEVIPHRLPELFELVDRPTPQVLVRGETLAALRREPARKGRDLRFFNPPPTRRPQQITLVQHRDLRFWNGFYTV